MPFLWDIEPRAEGKPPVWAAFATLGSQVERLALANVAWSAVLVPPLVALAWPELPWAVRILLALLGALGLGPATAVLYGMASEAVAGRGIDPPLARELLAELARPALRGLTPLLAGLAGLVWAAISLPGLAVALVPAVLLTTVGATYWVPVFLTDPHQPPHHIAFAAGRLALRHPEGTLRTWLACGVVLLIGVVSVAGIALAAPVLIALLQLHRHRALDGAVDRTGPGGA